MPKKLLMFGGVIATSVATLTPGGIFLQKAIKTKQMKEERKKFVSKLGERTNELNDSLIANRNINAEMTFLEDSTENEDKWKLVWIGGVFGYYKSTQEQSGKSLEYTKEEMEKAEEFYWKEAITNKKQTKWKTKVTDERLRRANEKGQYWEKFKEMCLILMHDGEIKEENNVSTMPHLLLCNFTSIHQNSWNAYENYKKEVSLDMREYIWTVYLKPSTL